MFCEERTFKVTYYRPLTNKKQPIPTLTRQVSPTPDGVKQAHMAPCQALGLHAPKIHNSRRHDHVRVCTRVACSTPASCASAADCLSAAASTMSLARLSSLKAKDSRTLSMHMPPTSPPDLHAPNVHAQDWHTDNKSRASPHTRRLFRSRYICACNGNVNLHMSNDHMRVNCGRLAQRLVGLIRILQAQYTCTHPAG